MKIGIAVSGTGGHIYPGISIAEFCLQKKAETKITFFCNKNNLSEEIFKQTNNNNFFCIVKLNIEGWKNRSFISLLSFLLKFFLAFFKSLYFIYKFKIEIVVGLGGYLSIPVVLAAKFLRRKTIIQEQNFYPGIANRLLNIFADKTAVGFVESKEYFYRKKNVFFTGNPIRKEFYFNIDKNVAREKLNIPIHKKIIFIFGGSQGSKFLNNLPALINSIKEKNDIFVIHITGENDYEKVKNSYEKLKIPALVEKYMRDIFYAYFAADLIISRAGASSITEILVAKKFAILIPYPFATENHQLKNAMFLQNLGMAKIYEEKNFSNETQKMLNDINYFLTEKMKNFDFNFHKNSDFSFAENLYSLIIN